MTTKEWYASTVLMPLLAKSLNEEPLKSLLELLQTKARATALNTSDVTQIALHHSYLAGYQKALDDIVTLSQPPKQKPTPLEEWTSKNK